MLLTVLLCTAIFVTELDDRPASALEAVDAAAVACLSDHFLEPDAETTVLYQMPVARVNGCMVRAGEVLERFDAYLHQIRENVSPSEYADIVQSIIERELPETIVWIVYENEILSKLDENGRQHAQLQLERLWKKELTRLAREVVGSDLQITVSLEMIKRKFFQKGIVREHLFPKFTNSLDEADRVEWLKNRDQLLENAKIETAYSISWPPKFE